MRMAAKATIMTIDRPKGTGREFRAGGAAAPLLKLMTLLSPAFPIGAFSYSHGLEQAIDSDVVRSAGQLRSWLIDLLMHGSAWNDAVVFTEAHRAACAGDISRLRSVAELASALAPSRERHLEATAQGRAFLDATCIAWPSRSLEALGDSAATYGVALAAVAADHGIAAESALPAYLNAFMANLVSVGVRLIPIGQSAGIELLAALHPLIATSAERALRSTLDDLGSATILSDILSMRHEEQYSRVFRT